MAYSHALEPYLAYLSRVDGSDLHLKAGTSPRVRINGDLHAVIELPVLSDRELAKLAEPTMSPEMWTAFRRSGECDYAYVQEDGSRYRVNAFLQRQQVALAFRRIKPSPPTTDTLGLPPAVSTLATATRGLILVTGPTGSGKSSTLAAMVDQINEQRAAHIITLEDPIEYLHTDKRSLINQREIGLDTHSFSHALRSAMRQDPDVILVGEMRDLATVEAALQAAETGHLVLSTLHTIGAAETISRILDVFPPHQHQQVRLSLADILKGIVSQRLVRRVDGSGRHPACEVLVINGRVQQAIVDPMHSPEIRSIIAESGFYGMQTFDQALADLAHRGLIDVAEALDNATNSHDLSLALKDLGLAITSVA
ncbi:MAG: type IV pilus twitching motility protein PilT [Ferrimicrobium sp.]